MAEDVIVRAEGLGKKYIIGHEAERERYTALRDVVARFARTAGRRARDLARGQAIVSGHTTEEFWALKDVNFEVRRGEVMGVVGRNGAGKSTLLKVLSRITDPTEGRASICGRVSSLLEVGTGFHPELSGRENIYLNGAILGMSRVEIRRKFDEIVAFAEVERFLDTPVKRYSSGMYVRLAFAVAAHLEPEILIVDEVLAVGDAEFQKRCLGKMGDVSKSGRTILFVSHNMQAVRQLCQQVIWLEKGSVKALGPCEEVVGDYLLGQRRVDSLQQLNEEIAAAPADPAFRLHEVDVRQDEASAIDLISGKPIEIRLAYDVMKEAAGLHVYFQISDPDGSLIFESLHNGDTTEHMPVVARGSYVSTATIPANLLAGRTYELQLLASIAGVRSLLPQPLAVTINVHNNGLVNRAYPGYQTPGKLAPLIPWRTEMVRSLAPERLST